MFRSISVRQATNKIAHNTTVPGLGGVNHLQNLIIAEKTLVRSLQTLTTDMTKASEALKLWGTGVGADMSDILTASTMLMFIFSEALNIYANHEATIRGHLKSIRAQEESFEDFKQRHRALGARVHAAQAKANKMGPGNKGYQAQHELFLRLQEDFRRMDSDVMQQEAGLVDFTRSTAKTLMGIKFGGLQELCNRGLIAAHNGKLVIAEISTAPTQPGVPRPSHLDSVRTGAIVTDAQTLSKTVTLSEGVSPLVALSTQVAAQPPPQSVVPPTSTSPPIPHTTPPPPTPGPVSTSQTPAIPYSGDAPIPIIDESGADNDLPQARPVSSRPDIAAMSVSSSSQRSSPPPISPVASEFRTMAFYPGYLPEGGNRAPTSAVVTPVSSAPLPPVPSSHSIPVPEVDLDSEPATIPYKPRRSTPRGSRSRASFQPTSAVISEEDAGRPSSGQSGRQTEASPLQNYDSPAPATPPVVNAPAVYTGNTSATNAPNPVPPVSATNNPTVNKSLSTGTPVDVKNSSIPPLYDTNYAANFDNGRDKKLPDPHGSELQSAPSSFRTGDFKSSDPHTLEYTSTFQTVDTSGFPSGFGDRKDKSTFQL